MNRKKAVVLISGGLDSILTAAILKDMGIELLGVKFLSGFSTKSIVQKTGRSEESKQFSETALDLEVDSIDVSDNYIQVVKDPKYGYGSAMNPCLDCRIYMLKKAKEYMEAEKAHFVATGEVLGQRPMTQHYRAMMMVAKKSGLEGLLLRPLSARLLPETIPESRGWVNRDELYDIQGRSRKRQIKLAEKMDISDWNQPAGGCLLTDKEYGKRIQDLYNYKSKDTIDMRDFTLLKVGRHFRLNDSTKVIIGRNEEENNSIEQLKDTEWVITIPDHPTPTTLITANPSEDDLIFACRLTARYSDGREKNVVLAQVDKGDECESIKVEPICLDNSKVEHSRI